MSEIELVDRLDRMNKVAVLYLKGNRNPTQIAKELSMKRAEVLGYIEEYKAVARNDDEVKDRAREALHEADAALNLVVERSWETVEQADLNADYKTKATVLKNIADIEGKRVDMLQKAGLYDDAALGDELAQQEEKMAILVGILRDVTATCEHCKFEVARRLSKVTGKVEGIVVDGGTPAS